MPIAFIRKSVIFLIPVAMIVALPGFVFIVSGEYLPLRSVAQLQDQSKPILFGPWTPEIPRYKRLVIEKRRPDVLVLGASSAQQFRSAFFRDRASFYNGAAAAACAVGHRFSDYLDTLPPDYHPSLIIAHFDYQCFDPYRYDTLRDMSWDDGIGPWDNFFHVWWRKIYWDLVERKLLWTDVFRNLKGETYQGMQLVGMSAIKQHFGVRNDGSARFGVYIEQDSERVAQQGAARKAAAGILSGSSGYFYTDHIATSALIDIRTFLDKARARGIFVIGLLPPYHPEIYAAIRDSQHEEYRRTATELSTRLESIFSSYGFEFYDFADVMAFGGNADEMLDPHYGSEKLYLRLFIRMAELSPILQPYVDIPQLRKRLAESQDLYEVFYNEH